MSNPTKLGCPNNIGKRHFTDYRPARYPYTDVKNSNTFILILFIISIISTIIFHSLLNK